MPATPKIAFAAFDGACADAFLFDRAARRLTPLPGSPMAGARKPDYADAAPRACQSTGAGRSALDPRTDPERPLESRFVEAVAAALETLRLRNAFGALVVAAPPRALGAWCETAPEALRALVRSEIAKVHAGRDPKDLVAVVESALLG